MNKVAVWFLNKIKEKEGSYPGPIWEHVLYASFFSFSSWFLSYHLSSFLNENFTWSFSFELLIKCYLPIVLLGSCLLFCFFCLVNVLILDSCLLLNYHISWKKNERNKWIADFILKNTNPLDIPPYNAYSSEEFKEINKQIDCFLKSITAENLRE